MELDSTAYKRLIDVGRALSAEKDINSLLARILKEAKSMVSAEAGTLYLRTHQNTLKFSIVLNDTLERTDIDLPEIPLTTVGGEPNLQNIASRAANTGETVNVSDFSTVKESGARQFDAIMGYMSRSFLTVPLKNHHEESIGVLQLLNARDQKGEYIAFSPDSEALVEALASQASVALENRYLVDEQAELKHQFEREVDERTRELKGALEKLSEAHIILKELTTIDSVTGIRNRQYFEEVYDQEYRRALRQQYAVTVMLVDIDHFKRVNDTYGHLVGDDCLAHVAQDIDNAFNRPADVVARYGGEEFVAILPYIRHSDALRMADQLRMNIADKDIPTEKEPIRVSISIGVATMIPPDISSMRKLVADADANLYRAKEEGRNRVVGSESTP